MALRIGTFNVENLFQRYKFANNVKPAKATTNGFLINETAFKAFSSEEKRITAKTLLATNADVIGLQEIEGLQTLRTFQSRLIIDASKRWQHAMSIDARDPRQIDVGVLSRLPITAIRSHMDDPLPPGGNYLWSRDCLEVDIALSSTKTLTVYVNHLKSMLDKKDPCNGRRNTRARRKAQAERVREIVEDRFGKTGKGLWAVVGDMNDYAANGQHTSTAIEALLDWRAGVNVLKTLPKAEQWTHYFGPQNKCGQPESYHQLDYVIASKELNTKLVKVDVVRGGITTKAKRYSGPRFKGVNSTTVASDHCPVIAEFDV